MRHLTRAHCRTNLGGHATTTVHVYTCMFICCVHATPHNFPHPPTRSQVCRHHSAPRGKQQGTASTQAQAQARVQARTGTSGRKAQAPADLGFKPHPKQPVGVIYDEVCQPHQLHPLTSLHQIQQTPWGGNHCVHPASQGQDLRGVGGEGHHNQCTPISAPCYTGRMGAQGAHSPCSTLAQAEPSHV